MHYKALNLKKNREETSLLCKIEIKLHRLSSHWLENSLLPRRMQLSDVICSGSGPAGTTRECHRLRAEGNEGGKYGHPPPPPIGENSAAIISFPGSPWKQEEEPPQPWSAWICCPSPPVSILYLLSPLFSVPALHPLLYSLIQDLPTVTPHHSCVQPLIVYHSSLLLVIAFFHRQHVLSLLCSCLQSFLAGLVWLQGWRPCLCVHPHFTVTSQQLECNEMKDMRCPDRTTHVQFIDN